MPASAAGLISVGCVYLRQSYSTAKGSAKIKNAPIGHRCSYSSAGPSAIGALRPDILAPGNYVISSLSRTVLEAIPGGSFLDEDVVDPQHAVLRGTSMSTPFGTGAVALLLQKNPLLTQEQARAALLAGARPLADDGAIEPHDFTKGAGILDVQGALAALDAASGPGKAVSLQLRLSASYLASDGALPLWVLGIARDESGRPADLVGVPMVTLSHARVASPLEHPMKGLYRFAIAAESRARVGLATVRLSANVSAEREVRVGPDPWDASKEPTAGGGCAQSRGRPPKEAGAGLLLVLTACLCRYRSRRRAAGRADRLRARASWDRPRSRPPPGSTPSPPVGVLPP